MRTNKFSKQKYLQATVHIITLHSKRMNTGVTGLISHYNLLYHIMLHQKAMNNNENNRT